MIVEQQRYQVRFDWGTDGAAAIAADADVIVWVDAIASEPPPALVVAGAVITTGMPSAAAAARWVLDLQERLGRRIVIAVLAAGPRFAVDDLLTAGAIIDALGALGLDASSPEAAAAEGAYLHLKSAVRHLMTASVTAVAEGAPAADQRRIDPTLGPDDVVVLKP